MPAFAQQYQQTQAPQQLSDSGMAAYAPQPVYAAPIAQPQPVQPAPPTGHEGEYGSSLVTDLRQLNF